MLIKVEENETFIAEGEDDEEFEEQSEAKPKEESEQIIEQKLLNPLVKKFTSIKEEDEISEKSSTLLQTSKNILIDEEFVKILNEDENLEQQQMERDAEQKDTNESRFSLTTDIQNKIKYMDIDSNDNN